MYGREAEAIKWLRNVEGIDGMDGLDAEYQGPEEGLKGKKVIDVLIELARKINSENTDKSNILKTEKVFEKGFDPLEGGFRAPQEPFEIFDQWIEVLPTDQVVAVEYNSSSLNTR